MACSGIPSCGAVPTGEDTNGQNARAWVDQSGTILFGEAPGVVRAVNLPSTIYGTQTCPTPLERVYAGHVYGSGSSGTVTTDWNCWEAAPDSGDEIGDCVVCY
jgi:hypothetical protein